MYKNIQIDWSWHRSYGHCEDPAGHHSFTTNISSDENSSNDEGDSDAELEVAGQVEIYSSSKDVSESPMINVGRVPYLKFRLKNVSSQLPPKKKSKKMYPTMWGKKALSCLYGKSAIEIFEEFISKELLKYIVSETIRYAHEVKGCPNFTCTVDELKVVIRLLILSGYHSLPSGRD